VREREGDILTKQKIINSIAHTTVSHFFGNCLES
jgi:hypothetical protein